MPYCLIWSDASNVCSITKSWKLTLTTFLSIHRTQVFYGQNLEVSDSAPNWIHYISVTLRSVSPGPQPDGIWLNLNKSHASGKAVVWGRVLEEKGKVTFIKQWIKMPDSALCNFISFIFFNTRNVWKIYCYSQFIRNKTWTLVQGFK